jgi:hypothetical protein
MMKESSNTSGHEAWNKGKLVGQKAPFKLKDIWAIRVRLQVEHRVRELAMFDLGLDSKLRACDLVKLKVRDICHGDRISARVNPGSSERMDQRGQVAIGRFSVSKPNP